MNNIPIVFENGEQVMRLAHDKFFYKFPKLCVICKKEFWGSIKKTVCFQCKKIRNQKTANERNHRLRRVDTHTVDSVK